jgi:hypothetical protein
MSLLSGLIALLSTINNANGGAGKLAAVLIGLFSKYSER